MRTRIAHLERLSVGQTSGLVRHGDQTFWTHQISVVNVPSAEFPQYDLVVNVPRRIGPSLPVHTRYMIAHTFAPSGADPASCAYTGHKVPADRVPVLASNAEVILYIHGMDSRLKENGRQCHPRLF